MRYIENIMTASLGDFLREERSEMRYDVLVGGILEASRGAARLAEFAAVQGARGSRAVVSEVIKDTKRNFGTREGGVNSLRWAALLIGTYAALC